MTADFNVILNFNSAKPVITGAEFKAGDKGFTINMDVRELDPTGMTPKIAFYRSNGTSVESSAVTNVGNIFSYTLLGNELAVPGIVVADLKFYDGDDQRISSASFLFTAIADTLDGLGGGTESYSDELEQLSEEFEETLQEYKDAFGEVGVINPKGDYDSSEEYVAFDLVSYQGSSWVCREGCQGETPSTSSSYWQLWAAKGDAGPAGQDGADGRGIKSMAKNASDHLIITYDDDQTEDAGLLPAGPAGQDGQDGADGADGRGISSMTINGSGHLIITYDDSTTEDAGVIPGGGGGLYPHVIVISDTGSTVTLVKGATTVNASETSTGHFEADVPDYGTWTIHSVLSGDDATVTLNVDDVKVYTVDDSHFAASITVTYPSGATCALSATGLSPVYATGSPYTFTVHSATTYTITATIDGISKTDSVTITTAGQTESVTIEFGTIEVNYSNEFRGLTITCDDGNTTISKTAPSGGNILTFRPPNTGAWTITGSYSGNTYTATATVSSLSTTESVTLDVVHWKTFAAATDAEIADMVARADAGEIDLYDDCGWRVGQEHTIELSAITASGTYDNITWSVGESQAPQTVTLVLMQKGLYELVDSVLDKEEQTRTTCSFVVGIKECFSTRGYINATQTNVGSWNESSRRNWCNGGLRSAIPETLRPVFKKFKTITAQTYNGSTNQTSEDYFALFSEKEVVGQASIGNATEAAALTQIEYYQTAANRIKTNDQNTAVEWWMRSPTLSWNTRFITINPSGEATYGNANGNNYISPFGCL